MASSTGIIIEHIECEQTTEHYIVVRLLHVVLFVLNICHLDDHQLS